MNERESAMQEVLQAAVAKMGAGASSGPAGAEAGGPDPMTLIMSVLPKLLENRDDQNELAESIEKLGTEGLDGLRTQVRNGRKQTHRMHKELGGQLETLTTEVQEMREQLSAVGNAVLELARQLERIEIIAGEEEYDDYDMDEHRVHDDFSQSVSARPAPPKRDRKPRQKPRKRTPRL